MLLLEMSKIRPQIIFSKSEASDLKLSKNTAIPIGRAYQSQEINLKQLKRSKISKPKALYLKLSKDKPSQDLNFDQ